MNKKPKPISPEEVAQLKAQLSAATAAIMDHLKKNGTTDIWITISAPEIADGQYFGRITLDPKKGDANSVTIPVAFVKKQGIVTLTHLCDPTTFAAKTGVGHKRRSSRSRRK